MRTLALLSLGSLLAACGGGGDTASEASEALEAAKGVMSAVTQAATDDEEEETTIKVGDLEASVGEKVPEGFPLPVFEGTIIEMGQRIELGTAEMFNLHFEVPDGDPVEVADFYQQALQEKGLEVKRETHENVGFEGQKIVNLKVQDGTFLVVASIASRKEGGAAGTLRWQGPPGS